MTTSEDPCQTCGSPVRIVQRRMEGSLAEPRGEVVPVRKCTSPSCRTNNPRQRMLADTV